MLAAVLDLEKFAKSHPSLSSIRFTEANDSMSVVIYPERGSLHDTYSLRSGGKEVVWLPPGFSVHALPEPIVPIVITSVLFVVETTRKVLVLFEAAAMDGKYHTTELPIDLLEQAAGVKLIPAFPSPPNPTKDS